MSEQKTPRVRFAPSPTGYLHVGGARTALFNWLYARAQGGTFVLRVEDTDRQRSTEESYAAILRGMTWLGLDWDEGPQKGGDFGPYLQSERLDLYRGELEKLKATGRVYRCWCSAGDLEAREKAARDAGQEWDGYDGHCRGLSEEEHAAREAAGETPCWRLHIPAEGAIFWYDMVCDKREFQNSTLSDRVVFKADGFPTYNFAVVVDDHLMAITHVLRGDDHVSNTPFQLHIYDALEYKRPKFGHLPMILGPDRKRLSKRHGATSVEEFDGQGIVPAAMLNYLALLGWSIGASGDEVLTPKQIAKMFSIKKVNSSPASFDYEKLRFINGEHIRRLEPKQRLELARPVLAARDWTARPEWRLSCGDDTDAYLGRILKVLGNRFCSLTRLPEQIEFFFGEDFERDAEAVAEHLGNDTARHLVGAVADALAEDATGDAPVPADRFEAAIRTVAEAEGVKAGEVIHPCRVALTGQSVSAGIFVVMELIGAPRVHARLTAAGGR